jgi:hypothetical protein
LWQKYFRHKDTKKNFNPPAADFVSLGLCGYFYGLYGLGHWIIEVGLYEKPPCKATTCETRSYEWQKSMHFLN